MTGREKTAVGAAAVLTMGTLGYSAWKLLGKGILSWHIRQPETVSMLAELSLVGLLLFLFFFVGEEAGKARRVLSGCGIAGVIGLVCWLHELFLPALCSGIYTAYLMLVGMWFARTFLRKRMTICWDFLLGSAVTIAGFCLLSLMKLGSIPALRLWVLGSGILLGIWRILLWKTEQKNAGKHRETAVKLPGKTIGKTAGKTTGNRQKITHAAMLAAIVTLVLLQAGRMNLAVDFDSIWYGVRSDVMLDSGSGIYENLGTLGVVYTYSKGFETLCLPLAGLPSYSFLLAMNLWIAALVLTAGYRAARVVLDKRQALWAPFLMAALPGIMNMADTAKADLLTLFCQLLMLEAMLWYLKERRADWLLAGLTACVLSLTLKPTALVYSLAAAGMSGLWLVREWLECRINRRNACETEMRHFTVKNKRSWLMPVPAFAALIGIWGRTMKLVGVPVTSVFYGLFQRIGFRVKYPFYASGFPSAGSGQSLGGKLQFLASRLYGVLLNPQGDDMGHVIIAWGSLLPLALLILWCLLRKRAAEGEPHALRTVRAYVLWLLVPLMAVNLISLYALSQIDGNYYMMSYAFAIVGAVIWLGSLSETMRTAARRILIPVWCYGALLCCVTNWAWALGNGGIRPINQGYYPHLEQEHQKRNAQGSAAIWDIFASNPKTRVIALGEHPGVLTFPCWVQSYVDVSGYWGNPEVVADAPNFLKYLQFADVDYIYMEKEYVDTSVRIYQIVRALVETGWLYDVRDENGNLVLSVRRADESRTGGDGIFREISETEAETIQQNLRIFDERYIQHQ